MTGEQAKRVRDYNDCDKSMTCYWKDDADGNWYINFPTDDGTGLVGGLAKHEVEEHEDGTISVTPSILTKGHNGQRHGYLTKGAWHGC